MNATVLPRWEMDKQIARIIHHNWQRETSVVVGVIYDGLRRIHLLLHQRRVFHPTKKRWHKGLQLHPGLERRAGGAIFRIAPGALEIDTVEIRQRNLQRRYNRICRTIGTGTPSAQLGVAGDSGAGGGVLSVIGAAAGGGTCPFAPPVFESGPLILGVPI